MKRHASIRDIARLSRVSVSTVSRVLNNHPDVSQGARTSVAKAVELLNYRPNSRARQLVKRTAETICLVLSNREVINSFHARILIGVERYAKQQGRNLIFVRFDYSPELAGTELALPSVIAERGTIDGLIVAGTNHANFIEALRQVGIPFVVFANNVTKDAVLEELHSVGFDSEDGTRQATEYLINLHHRHIWCIADPSIPWYARCYRGYAKSMAQAGFRAQRVDLPQQELPYQYGKKCAAWLQERKNAAVTAIVAGDDEIALGVLGILREQGIQVPGDLSVVGFDDLEELKYFHPGLTTVRVDRERVGEELARLLFEVLEEPNMAPVKRMVPTQLVVRETCALPRDVEA